MLLQELSSAKEHVQTQVAVALDGAAAGPSSLSNGGGRRGDGRLDRRRGGGYRWRAASRCVIGAGGDGRARRQPLIGERRAQGGRARRRWMGERRAAALDRGRERARRGERGNQRIGPVSHRLGRPVLKRNPYTAHFIRKV